MENRIWPPEPTPTEASDAENRFYDQPILNSAYEDPRHHWELDENNRPTNRIVDSRRPSAYVSPIPKPQKRHAEQLRLVANETAKAIGTADQQYDLTRFINGVRQAVDRGRKVPESGWRVTLKTARLLRHWRRLAFGDVWPFYCQVEAVETLICLTEVAPKAGKAGREHLGHLEDADSQATADEASVLNHVAVKLATGAGKTTVMALLIAWQTVNAVRHPGSPRFTRGFLVVTPGVTIRQRLQGLQPNDRDNYYASRELMPADMLRDREKARIFIANYHAFRRRETLKLSAGGRALLQGRGPARRRGRERPHRTRHHAEVLPPRDRGPDRAPAAQHQPRAQAARDRQDNLRLRDRRGRRRGHDRSPTDIGVLTKRELRRVVDTRNALRLGG